MGECMPQYARALFDECDRVAWLPAMCVWQSEKFFGLNSIVSPAIGKMLGDTIGLGTWPRLRCIIE